MLLPILIV